MKNFNTNTTDNDEWLTPPYIIDALGPFDLDPCSPIVRPYVTAKQHYTVQDDGLCKQWKGRVFCNPPYGKHTFTWLSKLADHKNGIALIFARTETKGFHTEIWEKAHAVYFFKGRLSFHYVDGRKGKPANAPSCLVSYSKENTDSIELADMMSLIQGKLVKL